MFNVIRLWATLVIIVGSVAIAMAQPRPQPEGPAYTGTKLYIVLKGTRNLTKNDDRIVAEFDREQDAQDDCRRRNEAEPLSSGIQFTYRKRKTDDDKLQVDVPSKGGRSPVAPKPPLPGDIKVGKVDLGPLPKKKAADDLDSIVAASVKKSLVGTWTTSYGWELTFLPDGTGKSGSSETGFYQKLTWSFADEKLTVTISSTAGPTTKTYIVSSSRLTSTTKGGDVFKKKN